jgi:hypothetical protein
MASIHDGIDTTGWSRLVGDENLDHRLEGGTQEGNYIDFLLAFDMHLSFHRKVYFDS